MFRAFDKFPVIGRIHGYGFPPTFVGFPAHTARGMMIRVAANSVETRIMEHGAANVVTVATENEEMEDAIYEARATINTFFTAFRDPQPNQTSFLIKARFEDGDCAEHIWLADLDFRQHPATGVIANDPGIKTLSYMERVPFLPDQISDWMYMQDGKLVGGYTTKLLLRAQARQGGLMGLLKRRLKM